MPHRSPRPRSFPRRFPAHARLSLGALVGASLLLPATLSAAEAARRAFDIPAGDAVATLKQFAAQSGDQLLYSPDDVGGVQTQPVHGEFTALDALTHMLERTPLKARQDEKTKAIAVTPAKAPRAPPPPAPPPAPPAAANDKPPAKPATPQSQPNTSSAVKSRNILALFAAWFATTMAADAQTAATPPKDETIQLGTFEVMESKLLNVDIKRTRDDAQPYVVFNYATIEASGAQTIEDFLKQRLPMETTQVSEEQINSNIGARSQINLRGLGTNQTLVLIDGHRMGGTASNGTIVQPDINGIPVSAVERIEILPTSASGIYGGSATGGVVNIVLRRNYVGLDVKATYDNSFDTDSGRRRMDLSLGKSLEGGKTNVLLSASYSDGNKLFLQDRDFVQRGRSIIMARDPSYFIRQATPILGATPNIRNSVNANLVLKPAYGGTVLSSSATFVPVGYPGVASDRAAALVANAGKYNLALPSTAQSGGGRMALLSAPVTRSLMGTIRRQFTPSLQAFVELSGSERESHFHTLNTAGLYTLAATVPTNPFTTTVRAYVPITGAAGESSSRSEQRRVVGGFIAKLPGEWKGSATFNHDWNRFSNKITASTAVSGDVSAVTSGVLDVFRDTLRFPLDFSPYYQPIDGQKPIVTTLQAAAVRAGGPVWSLPAGRPTLSVLLEHREEVMGASFYSPSGSINPERSQRVGSAYAELKVPLVAPKNRVPILRALELQLAGRRDQYVTNGSNVASTTSGLAFATNRFSSVDPTVGLRWLPSPDVIVRASYATGFLPPAMNQLAPNPATAIITGGAFDPRRGNETTGAVQLISGGDPNLRPETSKTKTLGFVFTPRFVSGLRVSADWTRIAKRDNIASAPTQDLINLESTLTGRIIRGPLAAGDPHTVGPITAMNISPVNLARADLEFYDFQADFQMKTANRGTFDFFAAASRSMHFKTQVLSTTPIVENVGFTSGGSALTATFQPNFPLKWKGNAGLTWTYDRWSAGWTGRYFDSSYISLVARGAAVVEAQGNGGLVPSQHYHDMFVGYRFGPETGKGQGPWRTAARLAKNTEVRLGVKNVFNTKPPFDATSSVVYSSGFGDPRLASYQLSVKRSF